MVASGYPACIKARHSRLANKDVLYSLVERMAHVKNTSYVRRGNHYGERGAMIGEAVEIASCLPLFCPFCFDRRRFKILAEFHKAANLPAFKNTAKTRE